VGGIADLANHVGVPQLQQGVNPAASRANLLRWLDSIVTAYAPKHVRPRNMATGLAVPGHYDSLQAHEYTDIQSFVNSSLAWNSNLHINSLLLHSSSVSPIALPVALDVGVWQQGNGFTGADSGCVDARSLLLPEEEAITSRYPSCAVYLPDPTTLASSGGTTFTS
jgi:hypothetical protein